MPVLKFNSEAEWLAIRESYIGGSDVAALFYEWTTVEGDTLVLHLFEPPPEGAILEGCLCSYKTGYRLWLEKAGKLIPDVAENDRIAAGNHLEPAIAAWAAQKWPEWNIRKVRRYLAHDAVEGWGASLDYELQKGGVPVEMKNVDGLIFRDQWKGEGDDLTPPIHINLQLQHQIGCTKADHGFVVAMVGGNKLHRVRIDRHEATQARIAEAVSMFWASVKAGVEPLWLADFDAVKELCAHGDKKNPPVDMTGDEAAERDARRYMRWKRHLDRVEVQVESLKARIGWRMGEATKAICGPLEIGWVATGRPAKMIYFPEEPVWQTEKRWRGAFTVKFAKDK